MRHRAGRFGNDRGVAGIGLGFAGMQIGDAAHGQSRQIGDEYAFSAGDGHCVDFHRVLTHRFHLNLTHPETA